MSYGAPNCDRACKGNFAHRRVAHDCFAHVFAYAQNKVYSFRRKTHFTCHSRQFNCGPRGDFRRFCDNDIASSQGRCDGTRRLVQRQVPRGDDPDNAIGFALCVDMLIRRDIQNVSFGQINETPVEFKILCAAFDLCKRTCHRFAGVGTLHFGKLLFAGAHSGSQSQHEASAFCRIKPAPGFCNCFCSLSGRINIDLIFCSNLQGHHSGHW